MKTFSCFLLFILPFLCFSQKVEHSDYDKMLRKLLQLNVKTIDVTAVDEPSNFVFLDARERKEYEVSHIKNAIWCGYDDFDIKRVNTVNKNAKIVVYCSVGYRSERIGEKLLAAKFQNVSNLYGGIFEWKNAGKVVVDAEEKETEKVFAYSKKWGKWLRKGEKVY